MVYVNWSVNLYMSKKKRMCFSFVLSMKYPDWLYIGIEAAG